MPDSELFDGVESTNNSQAVYRTLVVRLHLHDLDTTTNLVIASIHIGGNLAKDILFTRNGRCAYIANYSEGTVNVIDTATYRVMSITTGAGSRRLALSPAGDRVFVTNYLGNSVSVIDTLTRTLIGAPIPVGINPRGIAITPSGDAIYVTNVHDGTVSIINSATLTVTNTIKVGAVPWQILITKDGTKAFVSNSGSGTVSVIDTGTQLVTTLTTGLGPFFSVTNPEQNKLYVSNSLGTSVMVFNISTTPAVELTEILNVGSSPFDLGFGL